MQRKCDVVLQESGMISNSRLISACQQVGMYVTEIYILCLKKSPTFKLSLTLSNLNRFSNFLHCWKAYEICYKSHVTIPTLP